MYDNIEFRKNRFDKQCVRVSAFFSLWLGLPQWFSLKFNFHFRPKKQIKFKKIYIFKIFRQRKIYMELLKIPFSWNWRKRSIQFKLRWFSPELTPLCMHEISIILFPSREFWILLTACQHNSVTPLGGPRRRLKTRNGLRAEKVKE